MPTQRFDTRSMWLRFSPQLKHCARWYRGFTVARSSIDQAAAASSRAFAQRTQRPQRRRATPGKESERGGGEVGASDRVWLYLLFLGASTSRQGWGGSALRFTCPPLSRRVPQDTLAQRGNELGNGTADEHSETLMRPHEPSVVITAGRSQPPTDAEFVVPPGITAGRSFPSVFISVRQCSFAVPHRWSTATRTLSHYKLGRTVDKPPTYERIECRTTCCHALWVSERKWLWILRWRHWQAVRWGWEKLSQRRGGAETRRNTAIRRCGDTATIGNRPSASLRYTTSSPQNSARRGPSPLSGVD
jgi:hypothetical protein